MRLFAGLLVCAGTTMALSPGILPSPKTADYRGTPTKEDLHTDFATCVSRLTPSGQRQYEELMYHNQMIIQYDLDASKSGRNEKVHYHQNMIREILYAACDPSAGEVGDLLWREYEDGVFRMQEMSLEAVLADSPAYYQGIERIFFDPKIDDPYLDFDPNSVSERLRFYQARILENALPSVAPVFIELCTRRKKVSYYRDLMDELIYDACDPLTSEFGDKMWVSYTKGTCSPQQVLSAMTRFRAASTALVQLQNDKETGSGAQEKNLHNDYGYFLSRLDDSEWQQYRKLQDLQQEIRRYYIDAITPSLRDEKIRRPQEKIRDILYTAWGPTSSGLGDFLWLKYKEGLFQDEEDILTLEYRDSRAAASGSAETQQRKTDLADADIYVNSRQKDSDRLVYYQVKIIENALPITPLVEEQLVRRQRVRRYQELMDEIIYNACDPLTSEFGDQMWVSYTEGTSSPQEVFTEVTHFRAARAGRS